MTAPAKRLEFGEPLIAKEVNIGSVVSETTGALIIEDKAMNEQFRVCFLGKVGESDYQAKKEQAQRIVACVNALAGLHIENGELRELLEAAKMVSDEFEVGLPISNGACEKLRNAYQKVTAP